MAPPAISPPTITYHPRTSNATPVDSPAVARTHVESFLRGWSEENLQLKLSSENLTKDIRCILQKASEKNLCRCEYDPEYQILKVKAMRSPLPKLTVLTPDEAIFGGGEKRAAWLKDPDNMIFFQERAGKEKFLQVVIEVGFSESYHDLVRDAFQWLLRSGGRVNLVIIVKVEEDKLQLNIHQKTEQFKRTRDQLVAKYGDGMSREIYETYDIECTSQDSSADLYEALGSEITASDWVGPISVFLEVWRLRDGEPNLAEPRIDILPTPASPRDLLLKVTDLIPDEHRASFPNFDATRTITLDMACFRAELDDARMGTAHIRALKVIRPLDKDESDPEFLPSVIS